MDFYERLRSMRPEKYQALAQNLSRIGNPQEIFAHIAAMPICCQEGKNNLSEVRIDRRFVVVCLSKKITIYTTGGLKYFYVSSCENSRHHDFCINNGDEFHVNSRYARNLYERLLALCPGFFRPSPDTTPIRLYDYRYSYLTIDSQNVTLYKYKLFNLKTAKTVLVIPVSKIRSCYQAYASDSDGDMYYIFLRMFDGTEHKIGVYWNLDGFRIAQRLKAVVPELIYEFPEL